MMYYKKQSGFVLFSVLTFILLASFLSLTMFDMAESQLNMANNFYQQQRLMIIADERMNEVYQQIKAGDFSCQIPITSSYELKYQLMTDRQLFETCQSNHFDYVFEILSTHPCVTIDHIHAAQFYRITGRVKNDAGASMIAQAVYSLNSSELIHCKETKNINAEQQSWRILN